MSRRRSRRRRLRRSPDHFSPASRLQGHPLDRWAMGMMAGLLICLGLLIFSGDHATARVRDFTWQDRQVGSEDRAFLLTFSRPMDPGSVEENLTITPSLPGKVSWAGRRMAYTLTEPIPYGESYSVTLADARDRFAVDKSESGRFEPFQGQFQTRKQAFLYIGVEGDEENRLVLADLGRQERTILTPKNLVVIDFEPYPLGDRVLFSASDRNRSEGVLNQQLYTVTTGIQPRPPADFTTEAAVPLWRRLWPKADAPASGELELLLDNSAYQNLKFDLSADGKAIVIQRVNQQNPADFGPWLLREGEAPRPIETEPGGDFVIAPDNQSLVLLQGEGTAIIDIGETAKQGPAKPLDFLPDYGRVFDFTDDGTAAAMVNFNQDDPERRFMESLFIVTNQGREEELLRVTGAILDAQFDPLGRLLYVLASELVTDPNRPNDYIEQPVLIAVDTETASLTKLLFLPTQQQRVHMSLAPDGMSMLLDLEAEAVSEDTVREGFDPTRNQPIWRLPLFAETSQRTNGTPSVLEPESFPFKGMQATWLP